MGQMFNYSWISCVISVNDLRFRVMRGNSVRFEMMPGVPTLAQTPSTIGSTREKGSVSSFSRSANAIIQSIRELSCVEVFLGVWMQFSFPS